MRQSRSELAVLERAIHHHLILASYVLVVSLMSLVARSLLLAG